MPHPHAPRRCALVLSLLALLPAPLLVSCAAGAGKDAPASREAQLRDSLASTDLRADPKLRDELKALAWKRSETASLRLVAITALADADEDDTTRMLGLMLPTETDWPLLETLCDLAAERGWVALAPALVRSWSRPVVTPPDDDRPERAAITRLHPGREPLAVAFDVFIDPTHTGPFAERTRLDAWTLLRRLDTGGATVVALLRDGDDASDDDLVADLRAAARDLHAVPDTGEQLDWLRTLRRPEHAARWRADADAIGGLTPDQRQGLAIRHAAAIRWAAEHKPEWLGASRAQLRGEALSRLDGRRLYERTGASGGDPALRETIRFWGDALAWGDLLALLIADEALSDPGLVAEFFRQADLDNADTSTEYGGALHPAPGDTSAPAFAATLYIPRATQRLGDRQFMAPPEMIEQSPHALFHYHFHADRVRNDDYAGPSEGDTEYARRYGRACLVLTFINRDTLNVDYYQGDGARIDLGVVRRR